MKRRLRKQRYIGEYEKRSLSFECYFVLRADVNNLESKAWENEFYSVVIRLEEWARERGCIVGVCGSIFVESCKPKGRRYYHYTNADDKASFEREISAMPEISDFYISELMVYKPDSYWEQGDTLQQWLRIH